MKIPIASVSTPVLPGREPTVSVSFLLQGVQQSGEGGTWQLKGDRIGLETTSLEASYRRWNEISFSLNYEQLPHYRFNDGFTPFMGSGTGVQTLPTGWTGSGTTFRFQRSGE